MDLLTVARGAAARVGLQPVPIALDFEVTHLCNSKCVYCDRRAEKTDEMSLDQVFAVLDQFHDLGLRHVSLDGGEPLMRKGIDQIVGWLLDRGVRVYMNSNGSLIPQKLPIVRRLGKVKISLDGPRECHDRMRGEGAFDKAVAGAQAARDAGTPVELTCVIGKHNVEAIDALIDLVEELGFRIIFQPARNSLFVGTQRDGEDWQVDAGALRGALATIARRKKSGKGVANLWASLRHFRSFPQGAPLPCAAGWIGCTMEPDGTLYHCGQLRLPNGSHDVVRGSVRKAFLGLTRTGCDQCWCARVVEQTCPATRRARGSTWWLGFENHNTITTH